jgi:DNA repair exonuclease SbcCD ATPase subunit/DNA repair exonuclease SbcCD nuclease subunit
VRIVHISDIHIRNFKYHHEYDETFQELYRKLRILRPDVIINTGDTVHAKTQITPELVDMLARHIRELSSIAPYRMILGNHDLNLKNLDRRDAISPVVDSLREAGVDVELWTDSEPKSVMYRHGNGAFIPAVFWVYPINDEESYPTAEKRKKLKGFSLGSQTPYVHIGLFHGSISGCVTDADWIMNGLEHDVSLFDGLDYVMMGDIHRHQSWNGGRFAYAGSLIQQNFGETPDKGFLLWEIDDENQFSCKHVPLKTPLSFHTIRAGLDLKPSVNENIPNGAYVRVITEGSFTSAEQRKIVETTRELYSPTEVIVVNSSHSSPPIALKALQMSSGSIDFTDSKTQEVLLRQYLSERNMSDDEIERIIAIDRTVQAEVTSDEDHAQGRHWRINKVAWSNFCQYGEDNIIDLSKATGVYGIFAANNSGKSTIFELITEGLYDRVTKDIPRNIDLINDDRDDAKIILDLTVDGRDYIIERTISRIKVGQRKKDVKEVGKMSLDFYSLDQEGQKFLLNGDTRPETEKAIRRMFGGFDEFCLTSMSPQHFVSGIPGGGDIINCKDTDRRRLLYRFLGLDVFERKFTLAKEALKSLNLPPNSGDPAEEESNHKQLVEKLNEVRTELERLSSDESDAVEKRATAQAELAVLLRNKELVELQGLDVKTADEMYKYVDSAQRTCERLSEKLNVDRDALTDKRKQLDELKSAPVEQASDPSAKIRDAEKKLQSTTIALTKTEERQNNMRKKLVILGQVPCGDMFPKCRFLSDALEARESIPSTQDEIVSLEKVKNSLNDSLISFKEDEKRWTESCAYQSKLDSLNRSIQQLTSTLSVTEEKLARSQMILENAKCDNEKFIRLRDELRTASELTELCTKLDRECKRLHSDVNKLKASERDLSTREGMSRSKAITLRADFEKRSSIERDRALLEIYCEAVGKNGVPRSVLTESLPNISREINQIVSSVSGMTVSLESDEEEQSLSLSVSSKSGKARPVSLSGGAEKFIVSLAIRAALCRITSLPRSNMFIVDEGFGKLDPENSQAIQRMFQYLKGMFDHVVIVSHTEVMRDMVDGTIDIGVDGCGLAHIEHT